MANTYPLSWPIGRPRWKGVRQYGPFKLTEHQIVEHLYGELEKLKAEDCPPSIK